MQRSITGRSLYRLARAVRLVPDCMAPGVADDRFGGAGSGLLALPLQKGLRDDFQGFVFAKSLWVSVNARQ